MDFDLNKSMRKLKEADFKGKAYFWGIVGAIPIIISSLYYIEPAAKIFFQVEKEYRSLENAASNLPANTFSSEVDFHEYRNNINKIKEKVAITQNSIDELITGKDKLDYVMQQILEELLRPDTSTTMVSAQLRNEDVLDNSKTANFDKRYIKHSVMLNISGNYVGILKYIKRIEDKYPNLNWGPIELVDDPKGGKRMLKLSTHVYLLGVGI